MGVKKEPVEEDARSATSSVGSGSSAGPSASAANGVSADKKRYNKFSYRLRACSSEVKDYYKELVKNKEEDEIQDFINDLIDMGPNLPADYISRKRTIIDEKESDHSDEWMAWKKAEEIEGRECLKEMVEANTVPSMRNPKLPADTKIPWPDHLIVKLSRKVEHKRLRTSDTKEMAEHVSIDPHKHESFVKEHMQASIGISSNIGISPIESVSDSGASGATLPLPRGENKPDLDPKVKAVVAGIRKAHSAWDKACREFEALVRKSSEHPNTKGCKFEKDLKELVTKGQDMDKVLVGLEQTFLTSQKLDDEQIKQATEQAATLHSKIKEGNKKAAALRPWFKL